MATETHDQGNTAIIVGAWLAVGLPLLWGVAVTLVRALSLFH